MRKIKILYDAKVIVDCGAKTGIFNVSYNILLYLSKINQLEISLFANKEDTNKIKSRKDLDYLWKYKVFNTWDFSQKFEKIVRKLNIKTKIDLYKKIICFICTPLFLFFIILQKAALVINKKRNKIELNKYDIFFSPHFGFPEVIINNKKIIKFIILYDTTPVLFPMYFDQSIMAFYNSIISTLDKSTYCLCISLSTKNDFIKFFGNNLSVEKMFVTYISTAFNMQPYYNKNNFNVISKKYNLPELNNKLNYFFSLGTIEPRKNHMHIIKCFINFVTKNNIDDLYLIIVGQIWENFKDEFYNFFNSISDKIKSKIIILGYVESDEDINSLLSNSLAFVYLSQYEGFGMPPLEAMQAGTPVITSNNSSIPEVVGDAGIMIDYDSEVQCIKAFEDIYFNENLRVLYIKKGLERTKMFSWENTANKIVSIFNNVI